MVYNSFQLAITNTITINNDSIWQATIQIPVLLESSCEIEDKA